MKRDCLSSRGNSHNRRGLTVSDILDCGIVEGALVHSIPAKELLKLLSRPGVSAVGEIKICDQEIFEIKLKKQDLLDRLREDIARNRITTARINKTNPNRIYIG